MLSDLNKSEPAPAMRGVVVPLVTPMSDTGGLDATALDELVDRVLGGGVHGLFLLGTCGEGPSLSPDVQTEVIDRVCARVAGAIPIAVAITDPCFEASLRISTIAADAGAVAVAMAPPFYYPLQQDDLFEIATRTADASPLPVVLYNMPQLTNAWYSVETVQRLMQCDSIIGIKDSSGDVGYLEQLIAIGADRPGWFVMSGSDLLLADSIDMGAQGGVCGGANLAPELFVDLYDAAVRGDADRIANLKVKQAELVGLFQCGAEPVSGTIRGIKAALAAIGIGNGDVSKPLSQLSDREQADLRSTIQGTLERFFRSDLLPKPAPDRLATVQPSKN